MGARWAWYARCEAGHIFSNFSGGSDGVCDAVEGCNAVVDCVIECSHMFEDGPCDCEVFLAERRDKEPPPECQGCATLRTESTTLRRELEEARAESEGRRRALVEVAIERGKEWQRAENAEAVVASWRAVLERIAEGELGCTKGHAFMARQALAATKPEGGGE